MGRLLLAVVVGTGAMLAASGAGAQGKPADALQGAFQGAWVADGTSCASVFASTPSGMRFKKPVDAFAPAFIVQGKRIVTPLATCRVRSMALDEKRVSIQLACANSVSYATTSTVFALAGPGMLVRYLAEGDAGPIYRRCDAPGG
ncbi:hypothetical protein NK718_03580 [Alsobacter sp. SYSU M60028]|uniref:DUF3617 family protein n=1 Tax=Alsobacter ponti TaxID=2962936 RepID=A0ABT1L874_9HYPH|nr:hypothetical protein [Alsobacter ponti]MCP8937584.1 hypothetical protein [Alsobacter ponti]